MGLSKDFTRLSFFLTSRRLLSGNWNLSSDVTIDFLYRDARRHILRSYPLVGHMREKPIPAPLLVDGP